MEIVDVVDENDKVLSQASKDEAHKKGLLHRCIIAEIKDSSGKWLLVKQASDRQDASQFVSPVGGHIRSGESESDALQRETLEETGVTTFTSKFVGKAILNRQVIGRKENHYFILYEIFTDQEPQLNQESVAFERFSETRLKKELKENTNKFGEAFLFIVENFYPDLLK